MEKDYIVFIDSGIGGLTTLAATINILDYNYLYFADNLNAPYGNHSKDEILLFLTKIIQKLSFNYKFKIVVLACNTATTSAIKKLKVLFPKLIFIGTEPAIKLAYNNQNKRTFCIATPTTIKQEKYINLVKSFTNLMVIQSYAPKSLASNIENYILNDNLYYKINIIKDIYLILSKAKQSDSIILGCTHYIYLKNKLFTLSNKDIFDGNTGIAKHIKSTADKLKSYSANNQYITENVNTNNQLNNKINSFFVKNSLVQIKFSNQNSLQTQKYIKILKQILAKKHFL